MTDQMTHAEAVALLALKDEQLAELAAQNKAMRDALQNIQWNWNSDQPECADVCNAYMDNALDMPNIATEILRKRDCIRDKQTIRDLANIIGSTDRCKCYQQILELAILGVGK